MDKNNLFCTKAHVGNVGECLHCKIQKLEKEIEQYREVLNEIVRYSKYEGNQWYENVKQVLEAN